MMFDPQQGTESRKRKAHVTGIDIDINVDAASQYCNGGHKSSSEAEAVRRRRREASVENRLLLCLNRVPDVSPKQFMIQFQKIMQDHDLCFYEKPLMRCLRAPGVYEMQLVFYSAEMATCALNLSGYDAVLPVHGKKDIYLERPPEYKDNMGPVDVSSSTTTTGGIMDAPSTGSDETLKVTWPRSYYYGLRNPEPEGSLLPPEGGETASRSSSTHQSYDAGSCNPEREEGSPPSLTSAEDTDDADAPNMLTHAADENEEIPNENEYSLWSKKFSCMMIQRDVHLPNNTNNVKTTMASSPAQVRGHTSVSDAELPTEPQPGADSTKLQVVAFDGVNKDKERGAEDLLQFQIQTAALEKAKLRRQLEEMTHRLSESEKSNVCLQQQSEHDKRELNVKGQQLLVFQKRWSRLANELDNTRRKLKEAQQAESEEYQQSSDDFDDESPAKEVKYKGLSVSRSEAPLLPIKHEPISEKLWDI
jgi:hypothetical protein